MQKADRRSQGWGGGWGELLSGGGAFFRGRGSILELDRGGGSLILRMHRIPLNCITRNINFMLCELQ